MSATSIQPKKKVKGKTSSKHTEVCKVVLCNCNCHSFDEVAWQLTLAINCSLETAYRYAELAHSFGEATVFEGKRGACDEVAAILADIGLVVRVEG